MIVWVFHARCYLFVHQVRQRLFIPKLVCSLEPVSSSFPECSLFTAFVSIRCSFEQMYLFIGVFYIVGFSKLFLLHRRGFFYLQTDSVQSGRNLLMLGRNRRHPGGVTSLQSFNFYFGNYTFGVRKRACWQITLTVWPNLKCTLLNTIKPSKTHCFRV